MEDSADPRGVLGRHAAALGQPFLRLNFVTLWVRDQEGSRRFFEEKLDFEAIVDVQTPEGGRWIVQMKLAMKREALLKLNRYASEEGKRFDTGGRTEGF